MKISIDTKEDSHEDIRKIIKMLQNIVGDSHEIFTNQPQTTQETATSPFASIFGDNTAPQESTNPPQTEQETQPEEASESTEDLFAELFSEEELKKMGKTESEDEEESDEEVKSKDKKYGIEFY